MNTDPKKSQRSSILARAAMLATLAYAVALLCAATPVTSLVLQGDANANGNSLTNAATLSAANGCFNHLYATNGLAGPVPATNLTGTVTNSVSAASVTSALFTGNASALTNFPSAATMGLGALATSNSVTTSNITGLGSGVAATLAGAVSGTGSLVGTSNATLASPTLTTPQATTYPTTYLVSILNQADNTGPKTFVSTDAATLNTVCKPNNTDIYTTANFRDPRIIKIGNIYWMSYTITNLAETVISNAIGLAWSYDLVNWTTVSAPNWSTLLTGSQNTVGNGCWYYDASSSKYYMFFATATIDGASPVSEASWGVQFIPGISGSFAFGTPFATPFSPSRSSANILAVLPKGSSYIAFLQSTGTGSGNYIELASASSLAGTWSITGTNNFSGFGSSVEACTAINLPSGATRCFFCTFGGGYLYRSDSTNVLTSFPGTWSSPVTVSNFTTTTNSTAADWIDVVPLNDLQSDQCLNALQHAGGSGVVTGNGGNIDIGSATGNSYPLHAVQTANGGIVWVFENPSTGVNAYTSVNVGQSTSSQQSGDFTYLGSGNSPANTVLVDSQANATGGILVRTLASAPIMFQIDGSEKGRFSVSGNLLISTTSDDAADKLQVNGSVKATVFNSNAAQTTSNGSVAGAAVFSMPFQGSSDKKVIIFLNGFNGTASYTFPVAFTSTNTFVLGGTLSSVATMTTTSCSLSTTTNSTGSITIEGY